MAASARVGGSGRSPILALILRSRAFARRLEGWATATCFAILRDAAKTPLLRMRSTSRPLEQLPDQCRDLFRRRDHLVHDGEMVGAGDLLINQRRTGVLMSLHLSHTSRAFHLAGKCFTGLDNPLPKKRTKGRPKWHLIKAWCAQR